MDNYAYDKTTADDFGIKTDLEFQLTGFCIFNNYTKNTETNISIIVSSTDSRIANTKVHRTINCY